MLEHLGVNGVSILSWYLVISLVEIQTAGYIVAIVHDRSGLVLCFVK